MAIVFGYGRTFLKEECIEQNFGLKVVLNIINHEKIKSINSVAIEDFIVATQRQASHSTTQSEFGLNFESDIINGIVGEPYDNKYGNRISGKDVLCVSAFMNLVELQEKLESYLEAYELKRYKEIGFDWVDNVREVRDNSLLEKLKNLLIESIKKQEFDQMHIAPPEIIDWDKVSGFTYSGIRKKFECKTDIDIIDYMSKIKPSNSDVIGKLRRDKLYAHLDIADEGHVICNIYKAILFQTECTERQYMLYSGRWYYIDNLFFERVKKIANSIPLSTLKLPDCPRDYDETTYNRMIAEKNNDFCLMDKNMVAVEAGPKQIEACDIFTKQKQFIHIKNKGKSATLSHLFSQGKVSAQCFLSDKKYRKSIYKILKTKFNEDVFEFDEKPMSSEFEIIYAIISAKHMRTEQLPFFSLVNLMLTIKDIERMNYKYSICFIKKA